MSKTKTPKAPASPKTTILVRMPQELVTALDTEVARCKKARPGVKASRSSVLRDLIAQHLPAVPTTNS